MKLEFAPGAILEAEKRARWWRLHRPKAPELFDEELRMALEQIRTMPLVGQEYTAMQGRKHRRVLMPKTHCHCYYRIVSADYIRIVSVGAPCAVADQSYRLGVSRSGANGGQGLALLVARTTVPRYRRHPSDDRKSERGATKQALPSFKLEAQHE